MSEPMFNDIPGADIPIESIPGCENVKVERVTRPAFLDHNGDALAVKTQKFGTLEELRDYLLENDGKLYVLKCWKAPRTVSVPAFSDLNSRPVYRSSYLLRSVPKPPANNDWFLAKSSPVMVTEDDFKPFVEIICRVRTDRLHEIKNICGEDKLTKRVGQIVLQAIAEKNNV